MDIEQQYPKKPNFGLVVGLSAGAMVFLLLVALLVLDHTGHMRHHPTRTPNASIMPMRSAPPSLRAA